MTVTAEDDAVCGSGECEKCIGDVDVSGTNTDTQENSISVNSHFPMAAGRISAWHLRGTKPHDIQLQIWRPLTPDLTAPGKGAKSGKFTLQCANKVSLKGSAGGDVEEGFLIIPAEQCIVQNGDIMGWAQLGPGSIVWKTGTSGKDGNEGPIEYGRICQGSSATVLELGKEQQMSCGGSWREDRGYGVRVSFCADPDWGFPMLLIGGIVALAYLAGGVVYGRSTAGATAAGSAKGSAAAPVAMLRDHPHSTKMAELYGLVRDGMVYARSGGGRARPARAACGGGRSSGRTSDDEYSSSKKDKKKSRSKKAGKDREQALLVTDAGAVSPAAAPPPAPAAREWTPTRTGHLAVGARETGVKVLQR